MYDFAPTDAGGRDNRMWMVPATRFELVTP